jgi:hypothetical protein
VRLDIRDVIAPNRFRTLVTPSPSNATATPGSTFTLSAQGALPVVLTSTTVERPTLSETVT